MRSLFSLLLLLLPIHASAETWYYAEEVDPMTDDLRQFLYGFPDGVTPSDAAPYIRLGCYDPRAEYPVGLTLFWGTQIRDRFPEGDITMAEVMVRAGSSAPRRMGWAMSDDRGSTYAPDAFSGGLAELGMVMIDAITGEDTPFDGTWEVFDIHRMIYDNDRVVFRTATAGGQEITFVFPRDNLLAAAANLRDHCIPTYWRDDVAALRSPSQTTPATTQQEGEPSQSLLAYYERVAAIESVQTNFSRDALEMDAGLMAQARMIPGLSDVIGDSSRIAIVPVPFTWTGYGRANMFIGTRADDDSIRSVLVGPGVVQVLDGTAGTLNAFFAEVDLALTDENVHQYLWLFTTVVQGEFGPFYLTEDAAGRAIPPAANAATRALIESHARPVTCAPRTGASWTCDALVYYGRSLFDAEFEIFADGMIRMVDDRVIVEDVGIAANPLILR